VGEELPEAVGEDLLRSEPSGAPDGAADEAPPDEAAEREEPAEPVDGEPPPEGPVPDWVIQRFEESIARRGEREEAGPAGEGESPS
jgi:hypothetical protein